MLDWFETEDEICVVTEFAQGELFEILEDDECLPEETVVVPGHGDSTTIGREKKRNPFLRGL